MRTQTTSIHVFKYLFDWGHTCQCIIFPYRIFLKFHRFMYSGFNLAMFVCWKSVDLLSQVVV